MIAPDHPSPVRCILQHYPGLYSQNASEVSRQSIDRDDQIELGDHSSKGRDSAVTRLCVAQPGPIRKLAHASPRRASLQVPELAAFYLKNRQEQFQRDGA